MSDKIFVSYSRKNEIEVRRLVDRLRKDGFDVWFDRDAILAGQKWADEIRCAVEDARAVLVCLSSQWIHQKGYVQKELRMIVEASQVRPWNDTWIIPVKLDHLVDLPQQLRDLHAVQLDTESGYQKLTTALGAVVRAAPGAPPVDEASAPSAFEEFFIDAIERGAVIHSDPWMEAGSQEELEFKQLLRGRMDSGIDAMEARDYAKVLTVWQPLREHRLFDLDSPVWDGRPYFLAQILSGKCHVFIALAQLNQQDASIGVEALNSFAELVRQPPFSMKGASSDRLSPESAAIHNLNYKDTLAFALEP